MVKNVSKVVVSPPVDVSFNMEMNLNDGHSYFGSELWSDLFARCFLALCLEQWSSWRGLYNVDLKHKSYSAFYFNHL